MNKKIKKIEEIARICAQKSDIEIVSVEFVKEQSMKILRVIARKKPALTIEDSAYLNKLISDELDKYDFIDEQYYLEVSSEGLERELKTDMDIKNSIGEYICIRGYKRIDGKKEFFGNLISFSNDELTIYLSDQKRKITINRNEISKIRLAVRF
ncbi:MAG: ribosome maturation factor RimP [Bacilli bacterium]|nr:ribosome maturation factor RimP [Bacilli bacterium]MDD4076549.1 ribosome maturation factor RimP [Bacilli bacterium]MDD4387743.1 ribosome maturation factor RimP [Bacilli bacterium]